MKPSAWASCRLDLSLDRVHRMLYHLTWNAVPTAKSLAQLMPLYKAMMVSTHSMLLQQNRAYNSN